MTLEIGKVLNNRYRIVRLLGQGGFGAVYRAWDLQMSAPCAVKENLETTPAAQRQFEREAKLLFSLRHSHLPKVYDQFTIPGKGQYLVMDYIDGENLQDMINQQGGGLSQEKVMNWFRQVCDALTYLHTRQPPVIHRDIKPANIKVTPEGEAVLVDFGIAKQYTAGEITTAGAKAVTPGYSPPEQYGEGETDAQSDVYALGATMYTLLTGVQPPAAMDIVSGTADSPNPAHELNPTINPQVSKAIQGAMQINRANRTLSVADFCAALEEEHEPPTQVVQPEGTVVISPDEVPDEGEQRISKRPNWLVWVMGIAVIVLLGVLAVFIINSIGDADSSQDDIGVATETVKEMPEEETVEEPQVEEIIEEEQPAPEEVIPEQSFKACQVTDAGGIDDQSFNATAWRGMEEAQDSFGIEVKYLESQNQTDYEKNILAFIEDGCDLIVTVGFLLGDTTGAAAEMNPDQKFSIVDFAYDPPFHNVIGQVFSVNEGAFLAGYLAAGVTRTGRVGTYGGMQIPSVVDFMDGYWFGVDYYNQRHGTTVEVIGWNPFEQQGLFTGNFESLDDGREMGESLMDEGADIILPVAGPVGFGTAAAVQEREGNYIIGVDSDWALLYPEYAGIFLTSVLKRMDQTTFGVIDLALSDHFEGGEIVGNLENSGVDIAPFHVLEDLISDELRAELEEVRQDIINGRIRTTP